MRLTLCVRVSVRESVSIPISILGAFGVGLDHGGLLRY
jgi:hypothetical protein